MHIFLSLLKILALTHNAQAFADLDEDFCQFFDEELTYFTPANGIPLLVPDRGVYLSSGTILSSVRPLASTERLTIGVWRKWMSGIVFQFGHLRLEQGQLRLGVETTSLELVSTWSFLNVFISMGNSRIELAENEDCKAILAYTPNIKPALLFLGGGTGFLFSAAVSHSYHNLFFSVVLSECPLGTSDISNTCIPIGPTVRQLVGCHSECATCVANTGYNNDCASCSGSRKLVQGFCQTGTCPSGFSDGTNTCTLINTTPVDLHFENVISGTYGGWDYGNSATFYPTYDANDPHPAENRGYYFNGNAFATFSGFIYPPSFTIAMWVMPLNHAVLLEKGVMMNYFYLQSTLSGLSFKYDAFYTATHTDALTLNDWNYLAVSVSVSATATAEITIKVNNNSPGTYSSGRAIADDSSSTNLRLGYVPFNGFIYTLEIYVTDSDLSTSFITSGCSTTCSNGACPPELDCPSLCDISEFIDTSGCTSCTPVCGNVGCVRATDCVLCEDPTDTSCTSFTTTVVCDSSCQSCTSTSVTDCTACTASYYQYDDLCVSLCPTGYPVSGSSCSVDATGGFVFHIELTQIQDTVTDLQSSIPVLTGTDNSFYPSYDSEDPYAAGDCRGYYFSGTSFMQLPPYNAVASPLLVIAAKFTLTVWVYPRVSGSGVFFSKLDSAYNSLFEVELNGFAVKTTFRLTSGEVTFTSAAALNTNAWSFVGVKGFIGANDEFNIEITINGSSETSNDLGNAYFSDEASSFFATIGATYQGSFQSFYTGFLWDLRLYNYVLANYATLLDSSTCSGGCTHCPVAYSNTCLCLCDIDEYYSGPNYNSCSSCLTGCTTGCVLGTTCNICADSLCLECSDYSSTGCTTCKSNASTLADCSCDAAYNYDATTETCVMCLGSFLYSSICLPTCPTGHPAVGNTCTFSTSRVFELTLDRLEGVLFDAYNAIPAVTGATATFYPTFEASDPYPVFRRGFYFAGDDYVQLPENSLYTTPNVVIGPDFTLQLWLKPVSTTATVTCRYDSGFSEILCVRLDGLQIKLDYVLSSTALTTHSCTTSLLTTEWNHVLLTLQFDGSTSTSLTCHINRLGEVAGSASGFFVDETSGVVFVLGTGQTGSASYTDFFEGFIYQLIIDNSVLTASTQTTVGCSEGCPICLLDNTCLVNCGLVEYWVGPAYDACAACHSSCTTGCRSASALCTLCENSLCDLCSDFTSTSCTACKTNSSPVSSCSCESSYVYDSDTESCINASCSGDSCASCGSGQYMGTEGSCENCSDYCIECTSAECIECEPGYALDEGVCIAAMSFALEVDADNVLTLTFTVPLARRLTTVMIEVENSPQFKSYMDGEGAEYNIVMKFSDPVEEGARVTVTVEESVRGTSGEKLLNTTDSGTLSFYFPQDTTINDIMSIAGPVVAGTAIASALISGNPQALWTLINTLQFIYYAPLGAYRLGIELRTFLLSLLSFSILPNLLEYCLEPESGSQPYQEAHEFGYDTTLFLLNIGDALTAFGLLLVLHPVFSLLRLIPWKFLRTLMKGIQAEYKFGFFIRWGIEVYLEALIAGLIQIKSKESLMNGVSAVCLFIACLCLFTLLVCPIIFLWTSYSYAPQIQAPKRFIRFHRMWGSLFYEFKNEDSFTKNLFYLFFFLRRVIYAGSQVFLNKYPVLQASINVAHSGIFTVYLMIARPFREPLLNWMNGVAEVAICMLFTGVALPAFSIAESQQNKIENTLIICLSVAIAIQVLGCLVLFCKSIAEVIREKKADKRRAELIYEITWASARRHANYLDLESRYRENNRVLVL